MTLLLAAVSDPGRLAVGAALALAGLGWALDVAKVASKARDLDRRAAAVLVLPVPPLWCYRVCGCLAWAAGLAAVVHAV